MKQETLNAYNARVTQANKSELVVLSYEIIIDSFLSAQEAHKAQDWIAYEKDLKRVQKLYNELMGSLNYQYAISAELLVLYRFCNKCSIEAFYQRKVDKLPKLIAIMERLRDAFTEVAKQDRSGSVMKNTQSVYAGLTYGRHSLNEVLMGGNEENRGFMA